MACVLLVLKSLDDFQIFPAGIGTNQSCLKESLFLGEMRHIVWLPFCSVLSDFSGLQAEPGTRGWPVMSQQSSFLSFMFFSFIL